jgi:DNA invertase Pin-like site-specific DNA recombinase
MSKNASKALRFRHAEKVRKNTEVGRGGAKPLLADGSLTSKEVASRFGVSKATLYRYLA